MALTNCYACGAGLEQVFPHLDSEEHALECEQWDNALVIRLEGGYGMFIDPILPEAALPDLERGVLKDYKVVICHECAHSLCDQVHWMARLIDPLNSHSHKPGNWIGHEGWDLPHK